MCAMVQVYIILQCMYIKGTTMCLQHCMLLSSVVWLYCAAVNYLS